MTRQRNDALIHVRLPQDQLDQFREWAAAVDAAEGREPSGLSEVVRLLLVEAPHVRGQLDKAARYMRLARIERETLEGRLEAAAKQYAGQLEKTLGEVLADRDRIVDQVLDLIRRAESAGDIVFADKLRRVIGDRDPPDVRAG